MATRKKQQANGQPSLEQSLEELELLVESLEHGDLSLEESLKAFEAGIRLTRQCQEALAAAEQKVQLLIEQNGTLKSEPFADTE
ncbi:MAG TPA: exodeoxyribonuclease VII small subunit [Pseudomonadales bacterium]|nr:exodeoxyribonuclease VII small subunit [Pseudomonadales bacterium]